MTWKIKFDTSVEKQLKKMDRSVQKKVLQFLHQRLLPAQNPRLFGKPLAGELSRYWSFRVGDYRILSDIQDDTLIILVVQIDHRRKVYK